MKVGHQWNETFYHFCLFIGRHIGGTIWHILFLSQHICDPSQLVSIGTSHSFARLFLSAGYVFLGAARQNKEREAIFRRMIKNYTAMICKEAFLQ